MWFKAKHISPVKEHWILELDYDDMNNKMVQEYLKQHNLKGVDDIVGDKLLHKIPISPERFEQVYNDFKEMLLLQQ
jgi:hypothetical protein